MNFLRTCILTKARASIFLLRRISSSSDKCTLEVDSKSGIGTLCLRNPPVNILETDMMKSMISIVKKAESDDDIRGILLTSKFDGKVFSAGLNLFDMYQRSHEHVFEFWSTVQDWYLTLYGFKKPLVGALNGHALAGGCALVMMCEHCVMQSGKTIGLNEARLGVSARPFLFEFYMSKIGRRLAESAVLKGTVFTAENALKIGLVNGVEPLENVLSKATTELKELMKVPQLTYGTTKMLLRQEAMNRLISVKKEDAVTIADETTLPRVQEGFRKHLEKMKANEKQE